MDNHNLTEQPLQRTSNKGNDIAVLILHAILPFVLTPVIFIAFIFIGILLNQIFVEIRGFAVIFVLIITIILAHAVVLVPIYIANSKASKKIIIYRMGLFILVHFVLSYFISIWLGNFASGFKSIIN